MEAGVQSLQDEVFVHPLSNPGASGICPEMLEVAEEANRAGDFNLAVEIYSSQLADLQQSDRGLCLRKADSLARAGRIAEALDSYCTAANLSKLRPEELSLLVDNITRSLREKELNIMGTNGRVKNSPRGSGGAGPEEDGESPEEEPLDLFSCPLCRALLHEPATLDCGHTFCRHCLDAEAVKECSQCKHKPNRKDRLRVNVVLSGLLDKWFHTECRARGLWVEGEELWKEARRPEALDKYDTALELAPSAGPLLCQRAELHLEMSSFGLALQDASSLCRMKPHWAKAHYVKANALSKAGRKDEALQEYFLCVALKPHWTKVKVEAQKVLSELFSSVFERDDLPTPLHILQGASSTRLLKPPVMLTSLTTHTHRAGCAAKVCVQDPKPPSADGGSHPAQSSMLPPGGLKRKLSADHCSLALSPPCKLPREEEASCSSQLPTARTVPAHLLDAGDMECSLCMRIFYEPVATPCGHTFCLKCLERCLDHNPNCPLCKENLSEYLATRGYNKTLLMEEVLQRYLGGELAERKKIHEEEMKELSNLKQEVPIFVCTMAFPTIPCPLHVFEPRYRLMIRRCMETGTRRFGMCIADQLEGFANYGCLLEVRDVKFFPDGRSVVDTIGVSRFRVLGHGQRDGYHTAQIEYLEDRKVEGEELVELLKLHDAVYEQASNWFTSLKDNMKSQILSHFGNLPSKDPEPQASPSGPAWSWWLLAVLPLESRAQLSILAMTVLRERLVAIRRVLLFVTRKKPC